MPATTSLFLKIEELFERHIKQTPSSISTPESEGLFNLIYFVTLPSTPSGFSCNEFFLRLSRPLHPAVKTRNEVGWLKYIHKNAGSELCKRVPKILFYSDTTDELGYEYTVVGKLPGETLCDIWEDIDPIPLVSAVVDVVQELREYTSKLPERWFGGFTPEFKPGPYVEYTLYSTEHIEKYWKMHPDETYETLNLLTPYENLTEYWRARIQRDIRIVEKHDFCVTLRKEFLHVLRSLPDIPESVGRAQPFLAHRDLILGNLLWCRKEQRITGILDWEFAGMYTLSDWNPGNTMWTTKTQQRKDRSVTQEVLFELLDEELKRRGMECGDPIFKEGTLEHRFARIVSLSYWIVRKHLEQEELETSGRVATWLKEFYQHAQCLVIGGHFPGSSILFWDQKLFVADTLNMNPTALYHFDRPKGYSSFSFMWSIINHIPLSPSEIIRMWSILKRIDFDTIYGGWQLNAKTRQIIRDSEMDAGEIREGRTVKFKILDSMCIQMRAMGHDITPEMGLEL
ncbi:hypothetical protein H072_5338 [Dactylellina haptotyla CBS 200.50]|uniref:Aminoglycoside phosphotransferase domain-containing protein n=1 Tax=Dactylellina haptotyla (strain CBS 200.50) TaxID=1284197 RepID=S8BMT6_DACHA|nr:hypothetical protein H072_5338 [Dactylellina haptotyla CBS 200.50]